MKQEEAWDKNRQGAHQWVDSKVKWVGMQEGVGRQKGDKSNHIVIRVLAYL